MRRGAGFAPASSSHGRTFRSLDLFLRLTVIPLSAASLWVMATNKQANDAYGKVEFSNITGLKYLVCTNAISLGYAAASILLSFLGCFDSDWLFFILDQVFAYLMVTSGSAATEVMYLAYQGDTEASWSEGCSYYGKFCSKGKASLFLHFAAFVCFVALSLLSAYEVFSKYEAPPLSSSKDVGDQAG